MRYPHRVSCSSAGGGYSGSVSAGIEEEGEVEIPPSPKSLPRDSPTPSTSPTGEGEPALFLCDRASFPRGGRIEDGGVRNTYVAGSTIGTSAAAFTGSIPLRTNCSAISSSSGLNLCRVLLSSKISENGIARILFASALSFPNPISAMSIAYDSSEAGSSFLWVTGRVVRLRSRLANSFSAVRFPDSPRACNTFFPSSVPCSSFVRLWYCGLERKESLLSRLRLRYRRSPMARSPFFGTLLFFHAMRSEKRPAPASRNDHANRAHGRNAGVELIKVMLLLSMS